MTFGPTVRYPAGPITPYGAELTLNDRTPLVALRSYDDSVLFNLMGGASIADPLMPERVELEDLRGLVPPWTTIDQKGATQDGTSFVDALYDPMEPEMDVRCVGRDPAYLRKVVNHLVASIDIKQEAELSWFTHAMGRWWAPVRWFKPPDNAFASVPSCTQDLSLRLRVDSAFWQSYPNIDQFRFGYATGSDGFEFFTAPGDPVTGWTTAYSGPGSGVVSVDGAQLVSTLAANRTVVLRNNAYTAGSDNPVATIELGSSPEPIFPANTYIDLWVRMNNTGTPGTDGLRLRLGQWTITLSSFTAGVETIIRHIPFNWPGHPTETFSLITGVNDDPRTYQLLRNNVPFVTIKETGTSLINASHRKAGVGMSAASGALSRPLGIRNWSIGDNTTVAQEGFLRRINVGDQPFWDRYTCIGPGMFSFAGGPGSSEMVQFGPLLPNQIMQVRTDPRKYGVVDMTAVPPTTQQLTFWEQAFKDFESFFSTGNVSPFFGMESLLGITPPQGNPYSLLKGRFTLPVPPRSPGKPVQPYFVKARIDDGNAVSQIIASGTPLRRLPY